jgi:hypothetical protein
MKMSIKVIFPLRFFLTRPTGDLGFFVDRAQTY